MDSDDLRKRDAKIKEISQQFSIVHDAANALLPFCSMDMRTFVRALGYTAIVSDPDRSLTDTEMEIVALEAVTFRNTALMAFAALSGACKIQFVDGVLTYVNAPSLWVQKAIASAGIRHGHRVEAIVIEANEALARYANEQSRDKEQKE